jgi:hypothetical protein
MQFADSLSGGLHVASKTVGEVMQSSGDQVSRALV